MASSTRQHGLAPLLNGLAHHINVHRFLWLLALTCFFIAWNRGIALLYGLLALVLAVLLASWLQPWLTLRGIGIRRRVVGPVQAGRAFVIHYEVEAPRPRYHLLLHDALPDQEESAQEQSHFLPSVHGHSVFDVQACCHLRGIYSLNQVVLSSGWPFGFVHLKRTIQTPTCELTVMPATFPIEHFPSLTSDLASQDGYCATTRPDLQTDFAGVREYRHGDSLKHIHWAASARHEDLIVREYESHDRPHLLVVLDAQATSNIGEPPVSTFEYAVSIAASLIEYATEQQWGLHLYAAGFHPFKLTVPAGSRSSYDYLEPLARLRADGNLPYPQAVQQAIAYFGAGNSLVTLRNHSESDALPSIKHGHCDIILQDQSFLYPMRRYPQGWQRHSAQRLTLQVQRNSSLEALFRRDQ